MKDSKIKLLVFHPSMAPYRIDFWNSLNEVFDLKIYFLHKNVLDQPFNQQELKNQLKFECNYLDTGFLIGPRAFRRGFLQIIRNFKPDIVFTYEYSQTTLFIYLIRILFGFKFKIYSICDDSLQIATNCRGLRKFFRNYLIEKIDGLIVVNQKVADWYKTHFKLKNECIHFPIVVKDTEFRLRLSASIPQSNLFLEKYKLFGKKCILFVGRLVTIKGLDRLIKSFAKISITNPDAVLVLVGSGQQKNELHKLVFQSGLEEKVLFVGRYEGDKLLAWYNIGQIFVLASHQEAFGAVVNEALLSGATVICSENAGASELIKSEINGNIFNPYDTELLSILLDKELRKITSLEPLHQIRPTKMNISFCEYFDVFKNNAITNSVRKI